MFVSFVLLDLESPDGDYSIKNVCFYDYDYCIHLCIIR